MFSGAPMLLFSSAEPDLKFTTLSQIADGSPFAKCLELVTTWFTDEWGYIHDKDKTREQAIIDRQTYLTENADKIYLVFYRDLVVGAFRIGDKEFEKELIDSQIRKGWLDKLQTSEIWFIYVDPAYRGLGAGRQMVQEIKRLSKEEMRASMVLLETLKPGLNHLYRTEDAELVCENYLDHNPTDVLRITL